MKLKPVDAVESSLATNQNRGQGSSARTREADGSRVASFRWSFAGLAARLGLQLVSAFLVARLLGPASYGVVGLGLTYMTFASLLLDQGMSQLIVRGRELTAEALATLLSFSLAVAVVIGVIATALAPTAAGFFHATSLHELLPLLSLALLAKAAGLPGQTRLQHRMDFRTLALGETLGAAVGLVLGVLIASVSRSPLCLAGQNIGQETVFAAVLLHRTGFPSLKGSRACLRDLLRPTIHVSATQSLGYVSRNADNVLIAKVLGNSALANYMVGYRIMLLPITNLVMVANRVLLPVYASLIGNGRALGGVARRASKIMSCVTVPSMVLIAVFSRELIDFLLGDAWNAAVGVTRILAIAAVFQCQMSLITPMSIAADRASSQMKWTAVFTVSVVIVFAATVPFGLTAVCLGYLAINVAMLPAMLTPLVHVLDTSRTRFLLNALPGLAAGVSCGTVALTLRLLAVSHGVAAWAYVPPISGAGLALAAITVRRVDPAGWADLARIVGRATRARSAQTSVVVS